MKTFVCVLGGLALAALPAAVHAQDSLDVDETVFDGDYGAVFAGVAIAPDYEGSDDTRILPVAGIAGEISGVNFTIRGPSLTLRVFETDLGSDAKIYVSPQIRWRGGRKPGRIDDEVVKLLPEIDGLVEAGFRVGLNFDDIISTEDSLSVGVSTRWDISGKGGGNTTTPSVTYRLPVSRAQIIGVTASAQWIDDNYARYTYNISPDAALASGLPAFEADGGFKRFSVGIGTARDLSGNGLDGGLAIGAGVLYTRLYGSAAETPTTSIRGSRDQWLAGAGVGYVF